MSAALLFAAQAEEEKIASEAEVKRGISMQMPSVLNKITPSKAKYGKAKAFTIEVNEMTREILRHNWEGRARIDRGITIPHGWINS